MLSQAILDSADAWMLAVRQKCESGRPADVPYRPGEGSADLRVDLTIGSPRSEAVQRATNRRNDDHHRNLCLVLVPEIGLQALRKCGKLEHGPVRCAVEIDHSLCFLVGAGRAYLHPRAASRPRSVPGLVQLRIHR